MKVEDFDHPIVFLFIMTLGVFSMAAILSWGLASIGFTGPLGLFKGGVMSGGGSNPDNMTMLHRGQG
jgi:hypothetical protein